MNPEQHSSDPLAASFSTTYAGVIAFITVVHEGSFASAAHRLGIGRSAVSRSVQRLEEQLNTRLFQRTTRSTSLTDEGQLFYESCRPGVECIIRSVEEMQALRSCSPRGQLRISATAGFGRKIVAPLLRGFYDQYPDIALDLILDEKQANFVSDRIDISFVNGRVDDGQVVAKQLVPMQMHICASPEYARQYGLPQCIEDLTNHRCVNLRLASGRIYEWEFKVQGHMQKVAPKASHCFNDPDLVLQAVLRGEGVAQLAGYQISDHLRSGELVVCLAQYAPDDRGHFICFLSRHHLPARIRVFVDYMTQAIRAMDLYNWGDLHHAQH